jgi:raffinose/stachyose/melibiose transport system permease protein
MRKKRSGRDRAVACALTAATWLITLLVLVPFLWMLVLVFKTNTEILNAPFALPSALNFENFTRALEILPLGPMYKNTFFIALYTQAVCLAFTFMSSYALTRLYFKRKALQNGLYLFLLCGLMIPTYILLFPIFRINILLKLVGSYTSVVLPLAASSIAFNTLMFVAYMKTFPKEVEEAALIDGCGITRLCTQVVLPLVKPVIVTVTIFNVLYVWNEYPLEVTLIQNPAMRTLSMGISMFRLQYGVDYGGLIAGTLLILVPQIIFYILFQKHVVGGLTAGAVKG